MITKYSDMLIAKALTKLGMQEMVTDGKVFTVRAKKDFVFRESDLLVTKGTLFYITNIRHTDPFNRHHFLLDVAFPSSYGFDSSYDYAQVSFIDCDIGDDGDVVLRCVKSHLTDCIEIVNIPEMDELCEKHFDYCNEKTNYEHKCNAIAKYTIAIGLALFIGLLIGFLTFSTSYVLPTKQTCIIAICILFGVLIGSPIIAWNIHLADYSHTRKAKSLEAEMKKLYKCICGIESAGM